MSDYQTLHISRTFNAPIQRVWDAWTQPDQLKQWFMPAPFSVASAELDVRTGGQLSINTKSPEGEIMPLSGEYTTVEEPTKLVMVSSPLDAEGKKLFEVQHSIELTEANGQTTLDLVSEVLWAGPNSEQYLQGMEPGLNQALDQMTKLIEAAK